MMNYPKTLLGVMMCSTIAAVYYIRVSSD